MEGWVGGGLSAGLEGVGPTWLSDSDDSLAVYSSEEWSEDAVSSKNVPTAAWKEEQGNTLLCINITARNL